MRKIPILPGELQCCAEPTILSTVLGSCVAVCLWDYWRGIGGMNHFVLPADRCHDGSPRYGDVAMAALKSGLHALGCHAEHMQAKIFGGADLLPTSGGATVGAQNIRFALRLLREEGIPIVADRTGGRRGQHILFHTGTGEVLFRVLPIWRL